MMRPLQRQLASVHDAARRLHALRDWTPCPSSRFQPPARATTRRSAARRWARARHRRALAGATTTSRCNERHRRWP
eukprot:2363848-Alexandrium_andersonii.AAC.1